MKELSKIQGELNAPKNQYNSFGKYKYRNVEDIQAALKPYIKELNVSVTTSDEIVLVGDRIYVKATATITNSAGETISTTGYAREAESKKGMDDSQVTGAASSYARKYALNGLFAIDDTKDADSMDNSSTSDKKPVNQINKSFGIAAKKYRDKTGMTENDLYKKINSMSTSTITNFASFARLSDDKKIKITNWLNSQSK